MTSASLIIPPTPRQSYQLTGHLGPELCLQVDVRDGRSMLDGLLLAPSHTEDMPASYLPHTWRWVLGGRCPEQPHDRMSIIRLLPEDSGGCSELLGMLVPPLMLGCRAL